MVREYLFFSELVVSILSERRVFTPYGMAGGEDGSKGKNVLKICKLKRKVNVGGKNCFNAEPGDKLKISTPGGGGYKNRDSN